MEPRDTILYVPFSITSNPRASSKAAGEARSSRIILGIHHTSLEIFEFAGPAPELGDPLHLGF
jgi:hypothetical protein